MRPGAILEGKLYESLAQLSPESDVILVGRVIGAPKVVPAAAPGSGDTQTKSTLNSIRVSTVLKGRVTAQTMMTVRQMGTVAQPMWDPVDVPLLRSGTSYLLYLRRFEFLSGTPRNEWIITGNQGYYAQVGDHFERVGGVGGLPRSITLGDAKAAAGSVGPPRA